MKSVHKITVKNGNETHEMSLNDEEYKKYKKKERRKGCLWKIFGIIIIIGLIYLAGTSTPTE